MTQKPMLQAEVNARALRASQNSLLIPALRGLSQNRKVDARRLELSFFKNI